MIQTELCIVSNVQLAPDYWKMTLEAPQIAPQVRPGQFIHVRIGEINSTLLRRPFSIFRCVRIGRAAMGIEIIYKVVGRGTRLMTTLDADDRLDVIGPLGRGFEWRRDKRVHVLVAGGIGSASLFMLGEEISRAMRVHGLELYVLLGAETKSNLILEGEFKTLNGTVIISTDDGTYGHKGSATEVIDRAINAGEIPAECAIYACGPQPMLSALAAICQQYHIPAQVSMERHMMCGIGACFACVCKVDKDSVVKYRNIETSDIQLGLEEDFGYALVCKDGPVFNIDEVLFDE